jgi:hypothetical protein
MRVPVADWNAVRIGAKREFRMKPREGSNLLAAKCPTPVVAYTVNKKGEHACKLMVLEEKWTEPIIGIADRPDSIAREGFDSYDEFRRYWRTRNKGVYRPLERVTAFRVAELNDERVRELAGRAFAHLYGDYCDGKFSEYVHL